MVKRSADLEARLVDWAKEYGGGRYGVSDDVKSPMGSMMKWGGRPPEGLGQSPRTPEADAVEDAVRALDKQAHGWLPAQVLRCEYFTQSQPLEMKLQRLDKIGERLGKARYYQHLRTARQHVAAWLHIPLVDDDEDVVEAIKQVLRGLE